MGMIGTVIGFILMLGGSFESLNVADTGSVKTALTDMALGMSTALYTTLVGLVCSQLLKVQLVNVEEG
jgi:biopolymer transport protein ExbB/TolQ